MPRRRLHGTRPRSRRVAALAAVTATLCAFLGPLFRRDDTADDIARLDRLAAALVESDQLPCPGDCGCVTLPPIQPGHDYLAEALALTPALVQQMASVTAAEIAGIRPRA